MTERWAQIPEFPNYSVSDEGRVRNDQTKRLFNRVRNQYGVIYAALSRDNKQHNVSVAKLVAQAYLELPTDLTQNTVTHKDTDFDNLHWWNLAWRRRYFAIAYHKQYKNGPLIGRPIRIAETGETFMDSWEACMKYTILDVDIAKSVINGDWVTPIMQHFELAE